MDTELQKYYGRGYNVMNRRRFLSGVGATGVIAGAQVAGWREAVASPATPLFPELEKVGDKYSFAIIADPQVHNADFANAIYQTSQRKLSAIVEEVNQTSPQPAFVVINGDLVTHTSLARGGPAQMENFISRVRPLEPTTILVHGNHDGREPWTEFKKMQKAVNGTEVVWFSWNAGCWHFIAIPAYLDTDESKKKLYAWMAQDLQENKDRPTMFFVHWHMLPGYQTNHEWYTFDKPVRKKILELLTQHGNVRHAFFGHVHNGIKTAVKSAWDYKGIKTVTVPTCIAPRNFGEEFSEFSEALGESDYEGDTGGGYYVVVDVDGEEVTVRCKVVSNKNEYVITDYKPYQDNEPLWFANAVDLPVNPKLVNGSFESGLDGWLMPLRYLTDEEPGYLVEATPNPAGGGAGAVVQVREKGQRWASDETMEVYQAVAMPSPNPVFEASYSLEEPADNGGGYIRLCLYSGSQLQFLILFDCTNADRARTQRVPQHTAWMATGMKDSCIPTELIKMGHNRKAAFWTTSAEPEMWHTLRVDIGTVYDTLMEKKGAFSALGVDRMVVGAGAWTFASEPGLVSRVRFDNLNLVSANKPAENGILFNGNPLPVSSQSFTTEFGNRKARGRATNASQTTNSEAPSSQNIADSNDATPVQPSNASNQKKVLSEEERAAKRLKSASVSPEEKAEKRRRKALRLEDNQGI